MCSDFSLNILPFKPTTDSSFESPSQIDVFVNICRLTKTLIREELSTEESVVDYDSILKPYIDENVDSRWAIEGRVSRRI